MSIEINIQSPNKKHLAQIIKDIADLIMVVGNDTVTVVFQVHFNAPKKKDC